MSCLCVTTKSFWCHCFYLGCIHVVLYLSSILKKVYVIERSFSAHRESKLSPFAFILVSSCFPSTSSQLMLLVQTLVLKSPSSNNLSLAGTDFTRVSILSQKISSPLATILGAYAPIMMIITITKSNSYFMYSVSILRLSLSEENITVLCLVG